MVSTTDIGGDITSVNAKDFSTDIVDKVCADNKQETTSGDAPAEGLILSSLHKGVDNVIDLADADEQAANFAGLSSECEVADSEIRGDISKDAKAVNLPGTTQQSMEMSTPLIAQLKGLLVQQRRQIELYVYNSIKELRQNLSTEIKSIRFDVNLMKLAAKTVPTMVFTTDIGGDITSVNAKDFSTDIVDKVCADNKEETTSGDAPAEGLILSSLYKGVDNVIDLADADEQAANFAGLSSECEVADSEIRGDISKDAKAVNLPGTTQQSMEMSTPLIAQLKGLLVQQRRQIELYVYNSIKELRQNLSTEIKSIRFDVNLMKNKPLIQNVVLLHAPGLDAALYWSHTKCFRGLADSFGIPKPILSFCCMADETQTVDEILTCKVNRKREKVDSKQEVATKCTQGNGTETGHIIVTTIGGRNGQPKQTISYMAERVVGNGSFGIVFQIATSYSSAPFLSRVDLRKLYRSANADLPAILTAFRKPRERHELVMLQLRRIWKDLHSGGRGGKQERRRAETSGVRTANRGGEAMTVFVLLLPNHADLLWQFQADTISYMAERVVGNGSFGIVFQAKCLETGETVAIKKVLLDKRYKNQELQTMRLLDHPNVVALKHCFFSTTEKDELYLNLVLEYVPEST
ncbi:hypothetical protein KSP40_PGU018248 [Platanthera guangdongensis]|uniref:Protein kinase domain-containing protein n=1 Tax=Platanthera guangdongensis TaxID=2320717 RepID=A0ABR2M3S1_9ASPA